MDSKKDNQSRALISTKHVENVLGIDKGPNAVMKSFKIKDFTSPGDGYICYVTSVEVDYEFEGKQMSTCYVAKVCTPTQDEVKMKSKGDLFLKESLAYDCLSKMNEILVNKSIPPLNSPNCYFHHLEEGKEIIYMEDMRKRNFVMSKQFLEGADTAHTLVVLKEAAKMHAASQILAKEFGVDDLSDKFKGFKTLFSKEFFPNSYLIYKEFCSGGVSICADIAKMYDHFKPVEEYLKKASKDTMTTVAENQMNASNKFKVMSHGDFWLNNVLFSYNDSGEPTSAGLIDFQVSTITSLAADINQYLYTCVAATEREQNMPLFLSTYFKSFESVMEAVDLPMHFTMKEFEKEVRSFNLHGLLLGCMLLPVCLMKDAHYFSIEESNAESIAEHRRWILENLKTLPQFKTRVIDSFQEIINKGLL